TEEIVRQAEKMYGKLVGFLESMNDIEKHLDKAQNSYKSARNKLSEGNEGKIWHIVFLIKPQLIRFHSRCFLVIR
ncbi:MAG: DNA recombination protein RmuC, partial [Candidatus Thioglobus sp.]|nr:DNA recombination protein RmuC [Candidatus Thioglobus sp.]